MQISITNNIKLVLLKIKNAKEFMKVMEKCSQIIDNSLARTSMGTLTTMQLDGSHTMHKHVIKMTNIAIRLKSLGNGCG